MHYSPKTLILIGLLLDLAGVVLLAWDVFRIQSQIREKSRRSIRRIEEVLRNYGGIDGWLKDLSQGGDFREFEYEDGTRWPRGGFDYNSAQSQYRELASAAQGISEQLAAITEIIFIQIDENKRSSERSIGLTVLALFLISLGFLLQIQGVTGQVDGPVSISMGVSPPLDNLR